jgi:hypothetical protein
MLTRYHQLRYSGEHLPLTMYRQLFRYRLLADDPRGALMIFQDLQLDLGAGSQFMDKVCLMQFFFSCTNFSSSLRYDTFIDNLN